MDAVLIIILLTALGFIHVVSNPTNLIENNNCDFNCKSYDIPICAKNAFCTIRFVGECMMEMYNCMYPHKGFHQVDDSICGDSWVTDCNSATSSQ